MINASLGDKCSGSDAQSIFKKGSDAQCSAEMYTVINVMVKPVNYKWHNNKKKKKYVIKNL